MKGSGTARYAAWSAVLAVGLAVVLTGLAAPRGSSALIWALTGWVIMAVAGVAGGAWAVSRHGDPGAGFLVAVVTCMLARLFAGAAAIVAAALVGMSAVWAFLAGAAVTYVVLQVFEMSWFLRNPAPQVRRAGRTT